MMFSLVGSIWFVYQGSTKVLHTSDTCFSRHMIYLLIGQYVKELVSKVGLFGENARDTFGEEREKRPLTPTHLYNY